MSGLIFSTEELNMTVDEGRMADGFITVRHDQGRSFEGVVHAGGICMECPQPRFGSGSGSFSWRFTARNLKEGDRVNGFFRIISNQGEYKIPYHVLVRRPGKEEEEPAGDQPDSFLDLARVDWYRAAELFRSPDFEKTLTDPHHRALWRGLVRSSSADSALEQFLTRALGKAPVSFEADSKSLDAQLLGRGYTVRQRQADYALKVRRSGWGHTRLRVSVSGDFISVPRTLYEGNAFTENELTILVTVHIARLHAGSNYGEILLTWGGGEIKIPVNIRYSCRREGDSSPRREIRSCLFMLTDNWQDYACGRIGREEWRRETRRLLDRLSLYDRDGSLARLMNIHLMIDEGRLRDAADDLAGMRRYMAGIPRGTFQEMSFQQYRYESDELYCYRLYLTGLCYDDEYMEGRIFRVLRERYAKSRSNWRIAWFYMQMEPEYAEESTAKWEFLRRQYARGSRTPVLYMEAWRMIRNNPAIVHERDSYLLRNRQDGSYLLQILLYAVRRGIMTEEVMKEVLILVDNSKGWSRAIWRILTLAFELESLEPMREEILQRICLLLIREENASPGVHVWYARALEAGIRLRGLEEAFIYSCPGSGDETIPDFILEDLEFCHTMTADIRAFVYRKLYEKREELHESYLMNLAKIRSFLQDQVRKGRAGKDLLILYRAALTDKSLGLGDIRALVPFVYAAVIRAGQSVSDTLIIVNDHTLNEQAASCSGGLSCMPVYGSDNVILVADRKGIRTLVPESAVTGYLEGEEDRNAFTPEEKEILWSAAPESRNVPFLLALMGIRDGQVQVGSREENLCLSLLSSRELTEECRDILLSGVLDYERERADLSRMQEILSACSRQLERPVWRSRILDYMVLGKSREALAILLKRGSFGIRDDTLCRICESASEDFAQRRDPVLAELCFEAFKKGDRYPALLSYTASYFVGLSEELEEVRQAMEDAGLPCESLVRRLCEQLQFSGSVSPSFEKLAASCAALPDARSLLPPLLIPLCRSIFLEEREAGTDLMDLIMFCGELIREDDPSWDACRLVWLRQMAGAAGMSQEEKDAAAAYVKSLLDRRILFPFFMHYREADSRLDAWKHHTFITCRPSGGGQGDFLTLHPRFPSGGGKHPGFEDRVIMHRMFEGYYVCALPLFTGEEVDYYITDDPSGQHVVEKGKAARKTVVPCEEEDRFTALDRAMTAREQGQTEAVISLLEQYYKNERIAEALFGKGPRNK